MARLQHSWFRARVHLLIAAVVSLLIVTGTISRRSSAPAADLPPNIAASVQRAVGFLQNASPGLAEQGLIAYALMSAGRPATDPAVKGHLDFIVSKIKSNAYVPAYHHAYEAGVDAMALAAANPETYKTQLQLIANYLIQEQRAHGGWDYPQQDNKGDTSITQYGMLGFWAASRAGATIPLRAWDRAASWLLRTQLRDGSSAYQPLGADPNPKHSMTAAATGSLGIARLYITGEAATVEDPANAADEKAKKKAFGVLERVAPMAETPEAPPPANAVPKPAEDKSYKATIGRKELDAGIGRGIGWLSRQYTIDKSSGWQLYYLYALERAATLGSQDKLNNRDWYKDGSDFLVKAQNANGSWFDEGGANAGTCFGILFLTRATEKIVPNLPKRRAPATFGGGLLAGGRGLPKDLTAVELKEEGIKAKKLDTPLDRVLAELENPKSEKVESAQAALVEAVLVGDRKQLIGQKDLLLKLAKDSRVEVRRTAYWALGRCNDLRVAPLLIQGLSDAEFDVAVEARNALCVLSRKPRGFGLPDDLIAKLPDTATQSEKDAAFEKWRLEDVAQWRQWYQSVRPYEERDKLPD